MTAEELFRVRIALLQCFLDDRDLDAVLLSRPDNFAMATGGKRNFVSLHTDTGAASLLVERDGKTTCVTNNIEAPRLRDEELFDWVDDYRTVPWFAGAAHDGLAGAFGSRIASDDGRVGANVHGALAPLRATLTEGEMAKYRELGRLASEAMEATLAAIGRGMAEADIAARLVREGLARRCQVPVCLVAADERIARYRHPLPTVAPLPGFGGRAEKTVDHRVMVVGGFQRDGLIVSITRFKCLGLVDDKVNRDILRIAAVDAVFQEATRPAADLGTVFEAGTRAYEVMGFDADAWHHHHQGGTTGYAPRTFRAEPGSTVPTLQADLGRLVSARLGREIAVGSAFAWNPSAPGVKSEDTFLLHADGRQESVTATPGLPLLALAEVLGRPTEVEKWGWAE